MKLNFRNKGEAAAIQFEFDSGYSVDMGRLSVDEATELYDQLNTASNTLAIWLKGHGVNLHADERIGA